MPSGLSNPEYSLPAQGPSKDKPEPAQTDIKAQTPDTIEQAPVMTGQIQSGIDHDN